MENGIDANTIVIVDDEEMVLKSISSLLELEESYEVKTFTSPQKALDFIREQSMDLVISDYLMPGMDGISFLSRVREERPMVPLIILTGYADKTTAIKAINDIGLFQYIEKPWNNDDLMIIIRNGIEKQKLMKKLQEKVMEINIAYSDLEKMHKHVLKTFI